MFYSVFLHLTEDWDISQKSRESIQGPLSECYNHPLIPILKHLLWFIRFCTLCSAVKLISLYSFTFGELPSFKILDRPTSTARLSRYIYNHPLLYPHFEFMHHWIEEISTSPLALMCHHNAPSIDNSVQHCRKIINWGRSRQSKLSEYDFMKKYTCSWTFWENAYLLLLFFFFKVQMRRLFSSHSCALSPKPAGHCYLSMKTRGRKKQARLLPKWKKTSKAVLFTWCISVV